MGVATLGKIGGPLARHLATGGLRTLGCDIRKEALDADAASGVASACKELAARCDLAIVGIGFDSQIEAAVDGKLPIKGGGKRIFDTVSWRFGHS